MAKTRSKNNSCPNEGDRVVLENLTPSGRTPQPPTPANPNLNLTPNPHPTFNVANDQPHPPGFQLDLTGYTPAQVDAILRVATVFPQPQGSQHHAPPRGSQLNQHGENEQSEAQASQEELIQLSPD